VKRERLHLCEKEEFLQSVHEEGGGGGSDARLEGTDTSILIDGEQSLKKSGA